MNFPRSAGRLPALIGYFLPFDPAAMGNVVEDFRRVFVFNPLRDQVGDLRAPLAQVRATSSTANLSAGSVS